MQPQRLTLALVTVLVLGTAATALTDDSATPPTTSAPSDSGLVVAAPSTTVQKTSAPATTLSVGTTTAAEVTTTSASTTTSLATTTTTTHVHATTTTTHVHATTTTTHVHATTTTTHVHDTTTTTVHEHTGPLTEAEARDLFARFFQPEDVDTALRVAQCESGLNPDAYNPAGPYVGLFQHAEKYWPARAAAAGYEGASAFDPEANTAAAAWLVYNSGWHHWGCY